jgi:hypothetical protein
VTDKRYIEALRNDLLAVFSEALLEGLPPPFISFPDPEWDLYIAGDARPGSGWKRRRDLSDSRRARSLLWRRRGVVPATPIDAVLSQFGGIRVISAPSVTRKPRGYGLEHGSANGSRTPKPDLAKSSEGLQINAARRGRNPRRFEVLWPPNSGHKLQWPAP